MSTNFGFSSELYWIEPQDIVALPDADDKIKAQLSNIEDEVVVLVGSVERATKDVLVCGREVAQKAIADNKSHIFVRFAFVPSIPNHNILAIFLKKLRQKYKIKSLHAYHTTMPFLRSLHIERGFRNAQNAYSLSKHWGITPEQQVSQYKKLQESISKNGFDDKYPIAIMLCRRCGIKDSVDDGHHRIGVCVENKVERIAIRFNMAGRLPRILQKLGLKIINRFPKLPD